MTGRRWSLDQLASASPKPSLDEKLLVFFWIMFLIIWFTERPAAAGHSLGTDPVFAIAVTIFTAQAFNTTAAIALNI